MDFSELYKRKNYLGKTNILDNPTIGRLYSYTSKSNTEEDTIYNERDLIYYGNFHNSKFNDKNGILYYYGGRDDNHKIYKFKDGSLHDGKYGLRFEYLATVSKDKKKTL